MHGQKRTLDDTGFTSHLTPAGLARQYMLPRDSQKNPTPWLLNDDTHTLHPSDQLHKEIYDFITYIRPRRYEHAIRRHVIHRIRTAITSSIRDVDVCAFGSFSAEIYLPTSDLDLAVISHNFARAGIPKYAGKTAIHKIAGLLRKARIAKNNKISVVLGARVPILKFIDALTGLQVDICFENLGGVIANRTFRRWREEYPAMPALAMVIKHFLEMRNQNEVAAGGLGGFTVICLIVALLQHHPEFSSGKIPIEENLGTGLCEFLSLYGSKFRIDQVGIDVAKGSYYRKPEVGIPTLGPKSKEYKSYWNLHVVDPNDPENNIARSSYEVQEVFKTFRNGLRDLEERVEAMWERDFEKRRAEEVGGGSLLGAILAGNYEAVEKQREVMREVYQEVFGEVARDDESFGEEGYPWRWLWDPEDEEVRASGLVVDGLIVKKSSAVRRVYLK